MYGRSLGVGGPTDSTEAREEAQCLSGKVEL